MPIGTGIVYNTGDLILSQVSSSGTAFLETKIAAATSSLIYFDSTARINSASLNSITVGTASYVSGSNSIVTNFTASNISASGTSSFGYVGIGTTSPIYKLDLQPTSSTMRVGQSLLGAFPANPSTFSFFGHTNLDNLNTAANYALLQESNGNTYLNASSGKNIYFRIANSDKMILNSSGQFGIGTTSPITGYLDVRSNQTKSVAGPTNIAFFGSGDGGNPLGLVLNHESSSGVKMVGLVGTEYGSSGNNIKINETLHVQYSGNVGIGTISPVSLLSVQGDINSNYNSSGTSRVWRTFATNHASGNRGAIVLFGMYDGSPAGMNVVNTSSSNASYNSQYLTFLTHEGAVSADERMRITPLGNVGIGTTNPIYLLDVYGSIRSKANTATGTILLGETSGGTSYVAAALIGTPSPAYNPVGKLSIQIPTHGIGTDYGLTEQMSIQVTGPDTKSGTIILLPNSGYVGIGTTSPAYLLDVSGSTRHGYRAADNHYFTGSVNISGGLSLTNLTASNISASGTGSFGAVGIGTSAIDAKLTILGTSTQGTAYTAINLNNTDRGGATIGFKNFTDSAIGTLASISVISEDAGSGNYNDGVFTINTAADTVNSERFRITSRGNVGIGTTSPAATLHVSGSSGATVTFQGSTQSTMNLKVGSIDNYLVGTSTGDISIRPNGSTAVTILSGGNVGIGTTNPTANFQVMGLIAVQSSSINFPTSGVGLELFYSTSNTASFIQSYNRGTSAFENLVYNSLSHDWWLAGGSAMKLTNTGNLGVGTTSPGAKLEISGSSNSALFNIKSPSSSTILYVSGSGAVGVGTSAYTGIGGNGYLMLKNVLCFVSDNTANSNNRNWSIGTNGQFNGDLYFVTSADSSSFPNDAYRISFTRTGDIITNGSIGVGTTVPVNKLQVNGNVSGSSFTSSISNAVGFLGTSSWAQNVVSASYATTAQTANALNASNTYTVAGLTSAYVDVTGAGTIPTTGIYRPSTKTLGLSADGTLIFKISNVSSPATSSIETGNFIVSGSVGIGTTNPTGTYGKLTVAGGIRTLDDNNSKLELGRYSAGASNSYIKLGTNSNALHFTNAADNADIFTILNGGNVGIGTNSPAYTLEVASGTSGQQSLVNFRTADSTTANNAGIQIFATPSATATSREAVMALDADGANASGGDYFLIKKRGNSGTTDFEQYSNASMRFGTNFISRATYDMTIANDGNVGIGTTSPGAKLDVNGDVYISPNTAGKNTFILSTNASNDARLLMKSDTTTKVDIQANGTSYFNGGNVIIGNTTAYAGLTISDITANDTNDSLAFFYRGTSGNHESLIRFYDFRVQLNASFGNNLQDDGLGIQKADLVFKTAFNANPTERMRITNTGNVGIGTTSPGAKLEISGSSNSALLNIKSPISGAIVYVSGSGAVGINTSNVGAYTLQVNGSFAATTKSFVIDHPTKAGKRLIYGSLESPYHGIRLTGRDTIKDGKCKVELPDYMYKLILHDSINIQLTGIKCNKTLYVDEINIPENYFTIAYDKGVFESYKDYDFFWDFTAIRADVPELNTEL